MSMKKLSPGDECLVREYPAGFEGHHAIWESFHGVIDKVYEHSAMVKVDESPELSNFQKRLCHGVVVVSFKNIDGSIKSKHHVVASPIKNTDARTQKEIELSYQRRVVLGNQIKQLYAKGFTQIEVGRYLGKSGKVIQNAQHAVGIPTPVRYRARFVNLDGEIQYFVSVGEAAEKLHVGRARLTGSDRVELLNGVYEHSDWIEFEGTYRKPKTAVEMVAALDV